MIQQGCFTEVTGDEDNNRKLDCSHSQQGRVVNMRVNIHL